MLREKIGIIGTGKIGSAILRGVIRGGLVEKNRLIASAPREAVRNVHAQETGVTVTSNNAEVVDFSDMVILTVKPQVIHKVLEEIGRGGMGAVYRSEDQTGGIDVAIKTIPPELSKSQDEMECRGCILECFVIVQRPSVRDRYIFQESRRHRSGFHPRGRPPRGEFFRCSQ